MKHRRVTQSDRLTPVVVLLSLAACNSSAEPGLPPNGTPGTHHLEFEHAGVTREAIVYVPESYDATQRAPMLLNFHGFGGTAGEYMEWADLRPLADEHGFVLVYPQGSGLDGFPHWNSAAPSPDNKSDADDFDFVDQLVDTIAEPYSIDADRIYAAGYSNGGMMAYGLACYRSDRIAAIAAVSGAMLDDIGVSCTPSHTSVLLLHGTFDSVLPYEGGDGARSVDDTVAFWTELNQITGAPSTATSQHGATQVESFRHVGGEAGTEVHHHRIVGGEHVWFDIEVEGVPHNRVVWNFLSRFGRMGAL